MTTIKTWILIKHDANDIDATFLAGLGCEVRVKIPEPVHFETSNGTRVQYQAGYPTVEITTTCEKQESMLQLKYSNNLHLVRVEYENFDMVSRR